MFKRLILLIGGLGVLGIGGVLAIYYGWIHINNPDFIRYPVRGIDISHHQKSIDWSQIDPNKIRFVFIKATEGGDFRDLRFAVNWKQARTHNIPHGAYHYYNFCRGGLVQAQNMIATIPNEPDALPPVIDLEPSSCELESTPEAIIDELRLIAFQLEQYYGKRPIWYVTEYTYELLIRDTFPNDIIWARDIYRFPKWANEKWTFWQYDSRTRLNGVSTLVDMNAFNGSEQQFKEWVNAVTQVPPLPVDVPSTSRLSTF